MTHNQNQPHLLTDVNLLSAFVEFDFRIESR